jgi:hypothetical protein
LALTTLASDLQAGVPPEALSADALAKAVALRDDSIDTLSAHALAYSAAFHQHRDVDAGQMLEVCLKYSNHAAPGTRMALMSDAAVFQARRRRSAELAEQWLAALSPTTPAWLRTRTEAAILEARGDRDGASSKLDGCEDAIRSLALPTEAQRDILLRGLRKWKAELRAG